MVRIDARAGATISEGSTAMIKMNASRAWLIRMVALEGGAIVSVGGWVSDLKSEYGPDLGFGRQEPASDNSALLGLRNPKEQPPPRCS